MSQKGPCRLVFPCKTFWHFALNSLRSSSKCSAGTLAFSAWGHQQAPRWPIRLTKWLMLCIRSSHTPHGGHTSPLPTLPLSIPLGPYKWYLSLPKWHPNRPPRKQPGRGQDTNQIWLYYRKSNFCKIQRFNEMKDTWSKLLNLPCFKLFPKSGGELYNQSLSHSVLFVNCMEMISDIEWKPNLVIFTCLIQRSRLITAWIEKIVNTAVAPSYIHVSCVWNLINAMHCRIWYSYYVHRVQCDFKT